MAPCGRSSHVLVFGSLICGSYAGETLTKDEFSKVKNAQVGTSAPGFGTSAAEVSEELTFMPVLEASGGLHELTLGPVPFGNYGFDTRGYNGNVPGPTFTMDPGETLRVRVVNDLSPNNSKACPDVEGEFCMTSITNFHTHGLHVSSKGVPDGFAHYSDDIFAQIEPGAQLEYAFATPANHLPGTHWYHPHSHHSTALQAGGGAAGVLIVKDPPGFLPSQYEAMTEKIFFISGHNLEMLQEMAVSSESGLFEDAVAKANAADLPTNVFLVNGQYQPILSIKNGQWYRARMIFAAVEQHLKLHVRGDAICDYELLAKDGVYLNHIPRQIDEVVLVPGGRADVAVSCRCANYPCTGTLYSGDSRRLQANGGDGGPEIILYEGPIMNFSVSEDPDADLPALPNFFPTFPCYLADLQDAEVPADNKGFLELFGPEFIVEWNGEGETMTYANTHADGATMMDWKPLVTFEVGTVRETTVHGTFAHPMHMHVNPYQIINMPEKQYENCYFQEGDWHDTLMLPMMGNLNITIRHQTDTFSGKMVVHCHILQHEDQGMMTFIQINGTDGQTWATAKELDPTCYLGAWDSSARQRNDDRKYRGDEYLCDSGADKLEVWWFVHVIALVVSVKWLEEP